MWPRSPTGASVNLKKLLGPQCCDYPRLVLRRGWQSREGGGGRVSSNGIRGLHPADETWVELCSLHTFS